MYQGKKKLMALSQYSAVTLGQARQKYLDAKGCWLGGINPMAVRKATKQAEEVIDTGFEGIFKLWFAMWSQGKAPKHSAQVERRVMTDIVPAFAGKAVDDISTADVRRMMAAINDRGAREVARLAHETTHRYSGTRCFTRKPNGTLPAFSNRLMICLW